MIKNIDRRQFIKIGISSGVLAVLPFGCTKLVENVVSEILKYVSDSSLPVNEKRTGVLNQTGFNTLSTLCNYVNQTWELASDLSRYSVRLRRDLALKTEEEPSYLTEYEHAIELIDLLAGESDSVEQAWSTLLFSYYDDFNFAHTKLGRARNFVFSEIIRHQIPLSGGFKSFGLLNYSGYIGGLYTNYKRETTNRLLLGY